MRATIIADDNAVYVSGEALAVDLAGLDPDIHAVQWHGEAGIGEIEYRYHFATNTRRPNERFADFAPFQVFVDRWNVAKAAQQVKPAPPASGAPINVIAD